MHENLIKLLDRNILFIKGEIDEETLRYMQEAMRLLSIRDSPAVTLYITSGGGSVDIGLDIYDFLRLYPGDVTGVVESYARSMAAVILQACKNSKVLRHSTILLHHISKRSISLDELWDPEKLTRIREAMEKDQQRIYEILHQRTGKSIEEIKETCAKSLEMRSQEAKDFGLVDEIL